MSGVSAPAGQAVDLPAGRVVDVAVIGAGVVGTAIARALSRFRLQIALIDRRRDVGAATSKANTAIHHTGFDAAPGSLESRLVSKGWTQLRDYCRAAGIALEPCGALLVAWTAEQEALLPSLLAKAVANGRSDCRLVPVDELGHREPHLGRGALGAMEVPGEGIVDPWSPPIAFAREAVANGVRPLLGREVTGLGRAGTGWSVRLADGREIAAAAVVNAAGLGADRIDRTAGHDRFTVRPRKGELIVFDKHARRLLRHIILPVPTAVTKGVLVSPTVFGNVLVGPTATDQDARDDNSSTPDGLRSLLTQAARILPGLPDEEVTAVYAGLRAATEHSDYVIERDGTHVLVGGIRSTGLTASLAIADHVTALLADSGVELVARPDDELVDPSALGLIPLGEADLRRHGDPQMIAADPSYGEIICHCERVSLGEIVSALSTSLPAVDTDGLRRRTRALTGRCQGFHCQARIESLLDAPR